MRIEIDEKGNKKVYNELEKLYMKVINMNIKLSEVFKDKYVKSVVNNEHIKIYDDKKYAFIYNKVIVNELVYYLTSEGFNGIIKKYKCGIIEGIEKFIDEHGINSDNFIKIMIDIFFDKYVKEDEIKCMWIAIPKDIYENLINEYRYVVGYRSSVVITNSFRIYIYYITKYKGKEVYVGQIVCDGGYYKLYKDYLNLGERVLCDDKWLTGRMFYGIKSDMFYLDRKLRKLMRKIKINFVLV